MQDIESLKADADALGVSYRSDIKADTLQAKIDKFIGKPAEDTGVPSKYKNTSGINLFTEDGRCSPDGVVSLTDEQAAKYKGLEKCS